MITGRDFIITSLQSWDIAIGSNAKNITKEISQHNWVLYVSIPVDMLNHLMRSQSPDVQRTKTLIKNKKNGLRQITASLWTLDCLFCVFPVNSLPDGFPFDAVNRLNNKGICKYILSAVQELQFTNHILLVDNDIYHSFYAKEFLRPRVSIYYRCDNMTNAFWKKHAPRLEPLLCSKNDLVTTNPSQLAEAVKSYNSNCYDIGQGVDLESFRDGASYLLSEGMKKIKRPIIGYMGWTTPRRLDADLMYEAAKRFLECSMVSVGGEDDCFRFHKLHSLGNVLFLGEKQQAEIATYMAHFDVCINSQSINDITIGSHPRKVDEYLALGKPVVATKTKAMETFNGYVYNCTGADEYVQSMHIALEKGTTEERKGCMEFAHTYTWENSASQLYSYINQL